MISRIPIALGSLKSVLRPDLETNCTPNCLELQLSDEVFQSAEDLYDADKATVSDVESAYEWRVSVRDPYETTKCVVNVFADSKERMEAWEEALKVFAI
jgi:hypothetical protein